MHAIQLLESLQQKQFVTLTSESCPSLSIPYYNLGFCDYKQPISTKATISFLKSCSMLHSFDTMTEVLGVETNYMCTWTCTDFKPNASSSVSTTAWLSNTISFIYLVPPQFTITLIHLQLEHCTNTIVTYVHTSMYLCTSTQKTQGLHNCLQR